MPTPLPEVIASRIVILGPDGRPRIELGLVNGEPAIRMFDAEGNVCVRLGIERDVDEEPEYSGLIAELRLTGGDDGGEATLTASYASYAGIDISSSGRSANPAAAGAWVEAKEGRIEASLHGGPGAADWSFSAGDVRVARHTGGDRQASQPGDLGASSSDTSAS